MPRPKTIAAAGASLVAGLLAGTLLLGHATAADAPSQQPTPGFGVNTSGQTYGSSAGVSHEDEPDLIEAIATNGEIGYVSKSDLYGDQPKAPEQAATEKLSDRIIPVYASDGTTVVGEFVVQGGREGITETREPVALENP